MSVQNQSIKTLLEEASITAVMHTATMRAFYAQLENMDRKTRNICSRFLAVKNMEPVERELLAEELLGIQCARTKVVEEVKQEAAKYGL